ncbi:MAG: DUF6788 family protein [Candidatus Humimicrobiaceae bacterium]
MENKIKKLEEEFAKIKKEIAGISYIKKGSITKCYQVCRNPNCRCHKDEKFRHGPYFLLTSKEKAKTKTFSVPEQMLAEVRGYIDNFNLLKSKFKRMEEITEELIKIKIKNYREELLRDER